MVLKLTIFAMSSSESESETVISQPATRLTKRKKVAVRKTAKRKSGTYRNQRVNGLSLELKRQLYIEIGVEDGGLKRFGGTANKGRRHRSTSSGPETKATISRLLPHYTCDPTVDEGTRKKRHRQLIDLIARWKNLPPDGLKILRVDLFQSSTEALKEKPAPVPTTVVTKTAPIQHSNNMSRSSARIKEILGSPGAKSRADDSLPDSISHQELIDDYGGKFLSSSMKQEHCR